MTQQNVRKAKKQNASEIFEALFSDRLPARLADRIRAWYWNSYPSEEHEEALVEIIEEYFREEDPRKPSAGDLRDSLRIAKTLRFSSATIEKIEEAISQKRSSTTRPLWRGVVWRVAALFIPPLLVSGIWLMSQNWTPKGDGPTVISQVTFPHTEQDSRELVLADDSRLEIFPGSYMEYDSAFLDRNVRFSGEAHFHVTPQNDSRRFVVETHHLTITVLGTDFYVSSQQDSDVSVIDLYHGCVEVIAGDVVSVLRPGDHFEHCHLTHENKITRIAAAERTYMGMEDLVFDGVSLSVVFETVHKNYGVEITVPDTLPEVAVYANFTQAESLEEVFKTLTKMIHTIDYEFAGDCIKITTRN